MPSPPHLRCNLTVEQKLLLIAWAKRTRWPQQKLADWATKAMKLELQLSRHAVGKILRSEAKLMTVAANRRGTKRVSSDGTFLAYDQALAEKVDDMNEVIGSVSGALIREAAQDLADEHKIAAASRPTYSNGWLDRFQKRWGFVLRKKHGESASVDPQAASDGRAAMLTMTRPYEHCDVYNMDETSFFYQADQAYTITRNKKVSGKKKSKMRMTQALACNADGTDKLKPLFIGTAKNPRAFKGRDVDGLGVTYASSKKGWMNSALFCEWLLSLGEDMRERERHILLLIDNVSSLVRPNVELTNVRLEFLPVNTASVLQPLDQGIIAQVKRNFTKIKARNAYRLYKSRQAQKKVDVYEAMDWAKEAWNSVKPDAIRRCWYHSGIVGDPRNISGLLSGEFDQ